MELPTIDNPQALAVWFHTGPTIDQSAHAFDQLVEAIGYDAAIRTWREGAQLADPGGT